MFRLINAGKAYADHVALQPTNLTINAGQTTVLIGPSGCGKSTLIRLLVGLITPDSGEVRFDDQSISDRTVTSLRHRMGYVIQDGGLFPHLTARGNVSLMAKHLGWAKRATNDRVNELAELTRFPANGLDRYPHELSGGQRQRVSLMRALLLDPSALLLDEPLGALDPIVRAELQEELRELFRRLRKTVVLVTHDLGEAAYFADTIVLMKDGSIEQMGPAADLWHRPVSEYVTRFVQAQRGPTPPELVT